MWLAVRNLAVACVFAVACCASSRTSDLRSGCPSVPDGGPLQDASVFNAASTQVTDDGHVVTSWLVLAVATVYEFLYEGGIGHAAPCKVPDGPVEFGDGRSYRSECFQCVAVSADFADMKAALSQDIGGQLTNYDHKIQFNYSVPRDGDGLPRRMNQQVVIRVQIQQRLRISLHRFVRWDETDRTLRVDLEDYSVDTQVPANGARALVLFTVNWPPYIVASDFRIESPPDRTNVTETWISGDCSTIPESRNCTQRFGMRLHAPFDRYHFSGEYQLGFKLDCRLPSCPDFEGGRWHKIDLELVTDTWRPQAPFPPFAMENFLNAYKDADHSIPIEQAFSWSRDAFFVYSTRSKFTIQHTHIEYISITHKLQPTVIIWDGERVNTDMIKEEHLDVRCPEDGSPRPPPSQCHFRFKFDRHDPLWDGALEDPYFGFNIEVGGLISYKKDGTDRSSPLLLAMSATTFAANGGELLKADDSNVPESGTLKRMTRKDFGMGEEAGASADPLFYVGVGLISVSAVLVLVALRLGHKARKVGAYGSVHQPLQPGRARQQTSSEA